MVCLLAAPWVQLSISAGNGWPHNALRHHWLMPISCHFRDCKALQVTSLTHVCGAIASVQTFTFTVLSLPVGWCWSLLASPFSQAPVTKHCRTTDSGRFIMRCACLLPQLSPGTHSSLPADGRLRLSRPGCLVLHWGGLPVQRRSPTQELTWPSVE